MFQYRVKQQFYRNAHIHLYIAPFFFYMDQFSEEERKVLAALKKLEPTCLEKLCEETSLDEATLKKILTDLSEKELVQERKDTQEN